MDDVLPAFTPRWDDPEPYDGPSDEERAAFGRLRDLADRLDGTAAGIRAWVTGAYVKGTSPDGWAALVERVTEVGQELTDFGRTVEGQTDDAPKEG